MTLSLAARRPRPAVVVLAAALLAGCASVEADRAFENVGALTEPHVGAAPTWVRSDEERAALGSTIEGLLDKPLGVDDAVRLALLNNRGLQASFADLGIAAADMAQAGRLPNPGFSFARLARGEETEIERKISLNLLGVLALPVALPIERRRFERAQLQAANDVVAFAAEVRRAWYRAVAAQQAAVYVDRAKEAAELRVEFARRLREAGNWSLLDYARQQAFYGEIVARTARARLAATLERERLARLLGLWGRDLRFALPDRLPDLPAGIAPVADLEARAMTERFDIRAGKVEVEGVARSLGLTRVTGFLNVLEVGYVRKRETGQTLQDGYEISLEIPIFDWGDAKVAKAESIYLKAANRLAARAVEARSAVRESYLGVRTAYDIARHYRDEVLPLRRQISEEMTLRFNGMLVGVFELLADANEQMTGVLAAIEAQRAFWLAETDLRFVAVADAARDGAAPPGLAAKGAD